MNETAPAPRLLMITGHVRSGTTMLRRLCDSHPDITVTNEWSIFEGLGEDYRTHCLKLFRTLLSLRVLETSAATRLTYIKYMLGILRRRPASLSLPEIEATLRSAVGGAVIVGDKKPSYWIHLNKFAMLPALTRIFIYRDCRDVVSSTLMRCRGRWKGRGFTRGIDTAAKAAASWRNCVEYMEMFRDALLVIRYEELVNTPDEVLDELGEVLGVDARGFGEKQISRLYRSSIGKHRKYLTDDEMRAVLSIAELQMQRLGYL